MPDSMRVWGLDPGLIKTGWGLIEDSTFSAPGETGSVNYMFQHVGLITFAPEVGDADAVFEAALEAGAENVESSDDGHEIYTGSDDLHEVARALEKVLGEPQSAKLIWQANEPIPVDEEAAAKLFKLLDALDDNDDVQEISGNYDIPDIS